MRSLDLRFLVSRGLLVAIADDHLVVVGEVYSGWSKGFEFCNAVGCLFGTVNYTPDSGVL
jgi:hypothetical protein